MDNTNMSDVSQTLFIPMGRRIYASKHFPSILYDTQALKLKSKIPPEILKGERQSQYTFLASASRCNGVDARIKAFLSTNPQGAVVELGCGLETTYFRCDNGQAKWYELDLPEVIAFRKTLIPCQERMAFIEVSAFDTG